MRFFILFLFPWWLSGQNGFGTIRGKVIDRETQLPLEGVSVQMIEENKGIYTDNQGDFTFRQLQPGRYTLLFSYVGYQQGSMPSI